MVHSIHGGACSMQAPPSDAVKLGGTSSNHELSSKKHDGSRRSDEHVPSQSTFARLQKQENPDRI